MKEEGVAELPCAGCHSRTQDVFSTVKGALSLRYLSTEIQPQTDN